jgi:uncharacterized iron-regulated membrane protein
MNEGPSLRRWVAVHRWTSLLSTLVLLLLCVTGLPLIFRAEIDAWAGFEPQASAAAGKPLAIETLVRAAEEAAGDDVVQFVVWEEDKPGIVTLSMAASATAEPSANHNLYVDAATAHVVPPRGPMTFLRTLHGQLFLGPFGPLVLGLVTCLFLAAIVSGVVVYAPFMRRLPFGAVRARQSRRILWLDLHNLLGIAIAGWMAVVGVTGMMNTWGTFVIGLWRADQLAPLVAPYEKEPLPAVRSSPDAAVATARTAAPGMEPYFLVYPGSMLTSRRHYAVFMRGDTSLTSRLVKPVLVDAVTGALSASLDLPTYVKVMLLAEPLHFGDYGGTPLKVLWAMLDLATIFVLASGLYLWQAKRGRPTDALEMKLG